MRLTPHKVRLCKTQGRLFQLSRKKGLDSYAFIRAYMNSETAKQFDIPGSHEQWAGEAYLLAEVIDVPGGIPKSRNIYGPEVMYWIGYIYRYWHFYKGESSAEIFRHANGETMAIAYPGYHTLDCAQAIDRLLEDD